MKSLFSFGFPFFLRVLVPGAFTSFAISPLYEYLFPYTLGSNYEFYIFTTIVTGLVLTFISDHVYRILEGYFLWPSFLRKYCISKLNDKLKKLQEKHESTSDFVEQSVISGKLYRFPLNENAKEGEQWHVAEMPTALGNILKSYEAYPESRYGISAIFFWPMFWMTLDKDARKEIDELWVSADCLTYISFASAIVSFFYLVTFIAGAIKGVVDFSHLWSLNLFEFDPNNFDRSEKYWMCLYLSTFLLIVSRLSYLASLRHHLRNGEFFRAIFSLKRDEVKEKLLLRESDFQFWDEMWTYLKYKMRKCNSCGTYCLVPDLHDGLCEQCSQKTQPSQTE